MNKWICIDTKNLFSVSSLVSVTIERGTRVYFDYKEDGTHIFCNTEEEAMAYMKKVMDFLHNDDEANRILILLSPPWVGKKLEE